jgi:DNA (cytosine-5)-methyltransferase 1
MKYADLFSGIGGFRNAADHISQDTDVKFECVGFSEIDRYALATYANNYNLNGEMKMHDITEFVEDNKQLEQLKKVDLLLGGFPCQSFSLLGKKLGLEDERGKILFSIDKLLQAKKPEFIVLENVRNIIRHDEGNTLEKILTFFKEHGYHYTNFVILDTQNFGLPQKRVRIFFVCSKKQLSIELTEKAIMDTFRNINHHSL